MVNPNRFYTYAYLREDKTPYYIGKGQGNRAYNQNRRVRPPKYKSKIIFLKQNLTEEEAFKHEIYMIAVFGRKDLGTGILRNMTYGGDGVPNWGTPEQRSKLARKRVASMTPEQRKESTRMAIASRTPEQRSETSRKIHASRTPEQRSEIARKGQASMTPERRSEIARKREASITPEQRSEIARKREANKTPEQRREVAIIARKALANRTPEQRSEAVRKGQASMTPERRSEIARKRQASITPEQRSEIARKRSETNKGKKWWSDGCGNSKRSVECPEEGWVLGRGKFKVSKTDPEST